MKRAEIVKLGLLTLSCVAAQGAEAKSRTPNIVYILIDDLGIKDLGCYGNKLVETPTIDNLAKQSMMFTQAYASPVSSATRASLISGQNTARHGVFEVIGCNDRPYARMKSPELKTEIPQEIETYADILSKEGYKCAIFGKWHCGRTPEEEGFAVSKLKLTDKELIAHAKARPIKGSGMVTAQSIEFMRQNQTTPFMLCVSHKLVHASLEAPANLDKKYRAKMRKTGIIDYHPQYLSMIELVDESVKMILDELERLKLADNTVVIFGSDNGGLESDMILATPLAGCNDPYRSQKGDLYEGGVHVPMLVRWPKVVKGGSVCDEVVINYDMFSTFIDIGGGKAPENQICDGLSLVPLFKGESKLARESVYWHFPSNMWTRNPMGSIRKGDYKLIENFLDGSIELYNLKEDIGELNDLSTANPEKAKELLQELQQWRKDVNAQMPTLNPNYDPLREKEMAQDWWK